jgi:aryl-alcohol dehydrogenase
MIDYWRTGEFPFHRLIRHYPFEAINEAIADSRSGVTIKPVLRMEG